MTKLKLGPLADDRPVKLSVELPAAVHRDLVAYAAALAAETGGAPVPPDKLVALVIGFGVGFVLRPVIMPVERAPALASPAPAAPEPAEPRGTQYFAAHLDEAREIVGQCAEGSVRGSECANAEQAVIEAEGRERFKKFMGN